MTTKVEEGDTSIGGLTGIVYVCVAVFDGAWTHEGRQWTEWEPIQSGGSDE